MVIKRVPCAQTSILLQHKRIATKLSIFGACCYYCACWVVVLACRIHCQCPLPIPFGKVSPNSIEKGSLCSNSNITAAQKSRNNIVIFGACCYYCACWVVVHACGINCQGLLLLFFGKVRPNSIEKVSLCSKSNITAADKSRNNIANFWWLLLLLCMLSDCSCLWDQLPRLLAPPLW